MMKDFASNLPSAEELIRLLQRSNGHNRDLVPSLALFGAGLLVGAGLALLLAPSSGAELRENLSEQLGSLRERAAGANGERHEGMGGDAA